MGCEIDDIDRGVLYLLQQDARNTTSREMASRLDVSASTIRNRISQLEENDILRGYYPEIDYANAGFAIRTLFVLSAPPTERRQLVGDLLDIPGVISLRELLVGRRNIHLEVVTDSSRRLAQITDLVHELGAQIDRIDPFNRRRMRPLTTFRSAVPSE